MIRVFKASNGDMFTSFNPDEASFCVWCYRGEKSTNIEFFVKGVAGFSKDAMGKNEKVMTPAQVNAWAEANDIRIEWPDDQPATAKDSLAVPPLTFREQAAIAAMQAMISCCRVNNLGIVHGDGFDSSYFNRETGMDHDTLKNEYDGCKEIAADAWVFAEHMDAERTRRTR